MGRLFIAFQSCSFNLKILSDSNTPPNDSLAFETVSSEIQHLLNKVRTVHQYQQFKALQACL